MSYIPYIVLANADVSFFFRGKSQVISADHVNYNKIVAKLNAGDGTGLAELVDIADSIRKFDADLKVENGEVSYKGLPLHTTLADRLRGLMRDGFNFKPLAAFITNLYNNPSKRAIDELYPFLEHHGLPITEDGCFLAYKAVKNNYFDIYTGRTLTSKVGETVTMQRRDVDDNYERDCSNGLHCGALDYVVQYGAFVKGQPVPAGGNRLMVVKVNPADVVSVPKYEGHPKIRVCKYVVVSEIADVVTELDKVVYSATGTEVSESSDVWDTGCDCDGCSGCDDVDSDFDSEDEIEDMFDEGYSDRVNHLARGTAINGDFLSDELLAAYHEGYDAAIGDGL